MRRWIAVLLLCLASIYLGATSLDQCAEGVRDDCAPICHIFCADGCATVPVPEAPAPPSPDPLPAPRFEASPAERLVSLDPEPEKDPPRA
ncbi:MAG: hypothetical protein U0P46_10355 [Holophagaceae bacterium]